MDDTGGMCLRQGVGDLHGVLGFSGRDLWTGIA